MVVDLICISWITSKVEHFPCVRWPIYFLFSEFISAGHFPSGLLILLMGSDVCAFSTLHVGGLLDQLMGFVCEAAVWPL